MFGLGAQEFLILTVAALLIAIPVSRVRRRRRRANATAAGGSNSRRGWTTPEKASVVLGIASVVLGLLGLAQG